MNLAQRSVEVRHWHLFCGLGGGARGFNRGHARVGTATATFRCLGGVDVDKAAIADFDRLAGVKGTVLDLFSRDQYRAFHGHEPPDGWRETTPDDIRRSAGGEIPHIGFGSAPCKGFSGLLSQVRSTSAKYEALNQLALRGLWLALEAWQHDPLEFWLWENVPRIQTRGRPVLDQMERLFDAYGYAFAETTHDCGELGELAQSRKRFLLVARHREKVPPFLYEPPKRPLRAVGEVLGRLPVPGPDLVLPMHRLPSLQWQTWVRLAFVKAGSDWRSLNQLRVADGVLTDFRLQPDREWFKTVLGVTKWSEPSNTVTAEGRPQNGAFSVADPRVDGHEKSVQLGVRPWSAPAGVVTGKMFAGGGPHSVADPRYTEAFGQHAGKMRVEGWDDPAHTVTGSDRVGSGALSIADPRIGGAPRFNHVYRIVPWNEAGPAIAGGGGPAGGLAVADPRTGYPDVAHRDKFRVTDWEEPGGTVTGANHVTGGALCVADPRSASGWNGKGKYVVAPFDGPANTVIGGSTTGNGAFAVADPRPVYARDGKTVFKTSGEYGVVPWDATSGGVTAAAQHDNGRWSVADPRAHEAHDAQEGLPVATDRLVVLIRALDGTYHRPFTTLELAALQSLVDPDELLQLHGTSDSAWRERIGNAVPPDAAQAIASVMGQTLLLAWAGETFLLSAAPVWVQPIAIALSVKTEAIA